MLHFFKLEISNFQRTFFYSLKHFEFGEFENIKKFKFKLKNKKKVVF